MGSSSRIALLAVLTALSSTAKAAPPPASSTALPKLPASNNTTTKPAPNPKDQKKPATTPAKHPAADAAARHHVAGGPTVDDTQMGVDSPELRSLYAAEKELFPPASPNVGTKWPEELAFPVTTDTDRPRVHASGLPPTPPTSAPPKTEGGKDTAWLSKLDLPDLPVRWDSRVVKYLEFFKDDARGRSMLTTWLKRSGKYRDGMRKVLKKKGMPEDLVWLSMIESGFDPSARSPVGAVGLWQFMGETGKAYGLSQDRWADQRMSIAASTEAAADFLADLHRRFGSWDLAMAGYNMGYGGVLGVVRRYNTNDYWALSKMEGSLPWETTLYVPKILAVAIISKNLSTFGYQDVQVEPALEGEDVAVAPGTALSAVAQACSTDTKMLESLNPELRASRTPPTEGDWNVKVPVGKASSCSGTLSKGKKIDPSTEKYTVKFGETLDQVAQAHHTTVQKLVELNGIASGELVRGGTVLLVPKGDTAPTAEKKEKPVVVVPQEMFVYPDRKRTFYRVQIGDTAKEICAAFKITLDELRRWNGIDPSARLVDGMTLQMFVPKNVDLSQTASMSEGDVRVVVVGTEEFLRSWDDKNRRRIVVTAKSGDTLESIGKKHGVSTKMMERINRRGNSETIADGESIVVWAPSSTPPSAVAQHGLEPTPLTPFVAPFPDRLP